MGIIIFLAALIIAAIIIGRHDARRRARKQYEDRQRLAAYEHGDLPRTGFERRQIHRGQRLVRNDEIQARIVAGAADRRARREGTKS